MRVVVKDQEAEIFVYDDDDHAAYPHDMLVRKFVIQALTAALKYILGRKRGKLDSEV